jgi:4-hydroxythreonine-4-phosphate dehydrogenase
MSYSSANVKQPVRLAITMGDPGGIGPEIALKAVCRSKWPGFVRFVLVGSREIWTDNARRLKLPCHELLSTDAVKAGAKAVIFDPVKMAEGRLSTAKWRPGKTGPSEGLASLLWIRAAVAGCQEAKFHGIVTGPICKYSIQAAGFDFPGHTEYLAFLAGRKEVAMMLIGGGLRVALVTRHLALAKVASALTQEKLFEAVELTNAGLKWMGAAKKPIGVCALNPHAGDNGLLGTEEISIISPAIKALRQKGMKIEGPIPADVIFHQAAQNKFSAIVAMYHDQGLGPLKMKAFETGVNLTLGLPFVRTSPDHGTAFNIAGKGIANAASMVAAIRLAINLARRPNPWK